MIRAALEISTLGLGQLDKGSGYNRSGIYRVTNELTMTLLAHHEVDISLLFCEFPYTYVFAKEYFEKLGFQNKIINNNKKIEDYIYKNIYKFNMFGRRRFTAMNIISKVIRRNIHIKNLDIIHSLYYPNPKNLDNKKTIYFRTIHDILPITHPNYFTKSHRKKFINNLKNIDKDKGWFFTDSEWTKSEFCSYSGVNQNRVFVNHLAVSDRTYHFEPDKNKIKEVIRKLKIPDGQYFLNVATLEPRKNLSLLINSYKKFLKQIGNNKEYYLVLTGKKGWLIDEVYRKIQEDTLLRNRVFITGFVPDSMLSELYSGALAFIFPSLYEGFGLPILEAMKCGVPVISSNTSSMPEVVGEAGILVNPKDSDELCQAMIEIVRNDRLREDLKIKGLNRSKLFTWRACADRTVEGYKFALDNK